jgi:hypothetical protein
MCSGADYPPHHRASKPPIPSVPDAQAQQHQVSAEPQGNAQDEKDHRPSTVTETTPDHQADSGEGKDKSDRNPSKSWWVVPDWWMIGFTRVLTASTISLGIFTFFLWRETRNAVKDAAKGIRIANETYIAAHRPLIVIRAILLLPPRLGNKTRIMFDIYNKGDTKACIQGLDFFMQFTIDNEVAFPIIQTESPILPISIDPGNRVKWMGAADINENKFLNHSHAAVWSRDKPRSSMEFRGIVIYEDIMLRKRQSSFHRRYDFNTRQFCVIKDSEFEYTD